MVPLFIMKRITTCALNLVLSIFFHAALAQSKSRDTMVNVGGYALHFVIIEGKGTPILFEAGGGDDAAAWNAILPPLSQITGAPLITYDRPGFGKSGLDTSDHGINHTIDGLEIALKKLGFVGEILCVGHSQGGIYTQVFAYRHPMLVKAAVMIDATTACFYAPSRLAAMQRIIDQGNKQNQYTHPGIYFQGADFSNNVEVSRRAPFPITIPVTDLVSDNPPFSDSTHINDWKRCHREFVAAAGNPEGITA